MSDSEFILIAGLGNPGRKYSQTRHNIGFWVIDTLSEEFGHPLDRSQFDAQYVKFKIGSRTILLVKPMTYMNRSGFSLQKFASFYKIDLADILVVHDDMDLDFGKLKIAKNRGHGGHNGIRSIIDAFGSKACTRVRVGVGHPGGDRSVTGHVLGRFAPEESADLEELVKTAAQACCHILENGAASAMNTFNTK